ncbi:hypothetical protein [Pseudohongiella nitratireducens]|uniref:hypothetical protein n=1 Tax=Pseudohongiella nitratireducens TaxID=1768907 RepID=UPI0030EE1FA9|tara:strand:+ start:8640 stop:9185 length:546 start_codon:yes stop_codon:yes gene_type:complete
MKVMKVGFLGSLIGYVCSSVVSAQVAPVSDEASQGDTPTPMELQEDVETVPAAPGVNFSGTGLPLNELHEGELVTSHPQMGDGTYADCYQFEATEGESYQFTLRSDDFNAYLLVGAGFCQDVLLQYENDNFEEGNSDARVSMTAEYPFYSVYINTFAPGEAGEYTMLIEQIDELPAEAAGN